MIGKHTKNYFQKYYIFFIYAILISTLLSCNITKKVPKGEYLLTKNKFEYQDKRLLSGTLPNYVTQKPNKKQLFFFPLRLMVYNLASPKYDTILAEYMTYPNQMRTQALRDSLYIKYGHPEYRGKSLFFNRILHTIGQPPVILDETKTINGAKNMKQYMVFKGYWDAHVDFSQTLDSTSKKAQVNYKITFNEPTKIKKYYYTIPDKNIRAIYEKHLNKSKVKEGEILDQSKLEEEVSRINNRMRAEGYYSFNRNGEQIYFTADTLQDKKNVPLTIDIHKDSINTPYKKTTIGRVDLYVVDQISDTLATKAYKFDKLRVDDSIRIHKLNNDYTTRSLWLPIILKNGEIYDQKKLDLSKRNLMAMNNFSILNYRENLERVPNDSILNIQYILKPLPKYELKTALDMHYSQILNFGFSPSVELTSRNIFGGGENLSTSFSGIIGTTKNAKNPDKIFNAYELAAQVSLNVPRLLIPFNYYKLIPKRYSPTTSISLGTSIQNNIGMGRINFNAGLTYTANVNEVVSHRLSLFNTQLSLTRNKDNYYELFRGDNEVRASVFNLYQSYNPNYNISTHTYDEVSKKILTDTRFVDSLTPAEQDLYNTFLQSLLNKDRQTQDVLIASMSYNFLYNEMGNKYYTNPLYFSGKIEVAGNILGLVGKHKNSSSILTDKEKTIFNIPYSQFIKFDLDLRKYFSFYTKAERKHTLVLRQFIGIGIPYGNSSNMPFIRSYFNGGSNDIRAWVAFGGLGPADSQLDEKVRSYIMDNLKLTTNVEYRFPINKMFEGAIFTDAGNIWSLKEEGLGDGFKLNKFWKQLGIGSGFGIRIDVAYIKLRLDLAYKIYDPNQPEGNRWRFKNFNPIKPTLNFAIGYPF